MHFQGLETFEEEPVKKLLPWWTPKAPDGPVRTT